MSNFKFPILSYFLIISFWCSGQQNTPKLKSDLEVYRVYGRQHPFQKRLVFADYTTTRLKRGIGSFFLPGTIDPLNSLLVVGSIPIVRSERYRNNDIFRFTLKKNDGTLLEVECKAILKVRERFSLLAKQDSSFWGSTTTDILTARYRNRDDTTKNWTMLASNLNAAKEAPQQGRLYSGDCEISFQLMNLLLGEDLGFAKQMRNFTTLNSVYGFTYKGEIIAAVSSKAKHRKFWVKEGLQGDLQDAIAATAAILTIRRDLYR